MKSISGLSQQVLVREAVMEDDDAIVRLVRQLGDDSEVSEEYVRHYLSGRDRYVLLAEDDHTVAGLLSYSVRADLYHAGNSVLIEELVVDAGFRGKGVGSALMDELSKRIQALPCKELCLAVMPDNEGAIHFYKRHGLTEEALFLERHFVARM